MNASVSRFRRPAMVVAAAVLAAGGGLPVARAQTAADAQPRVAAAGPASLDYRVLRASQVVGLDVQDPQGKDIGEVTDLMVDSLTGKVLYAILSFDPGILQGEALFAVPTSQPKSGSCRDAMT